MPCIAYASRVKLRRDAVLGTTLAMTRISWAHAVLLTLAAGSVAGAAPKPIHAKVPKTDVPRLAAELSGTDPELAEKAAEALADTPDPAAHDALLDALAFGLAPAVAVPAMLAIVGHPAPPDVAALRRYAGHQQPSVRGAALNALAAYPDPLAHAAIVAGLHDPTGIVRAQAANAAAKGRVREAYDPLFALLDLGEEPAAKALAELADPDLARRIGDHLGKAPDPVLAECLGLVLRRADFGPDSARVDIVRAIAKIADAAAVDQLTQYVDGSPKTPPRESRKEAQKVIDARLGGGK